MERIFVIEVVRHYKSIVKIDILDRFFGTEVAAREWLKKQYSPWFDEEHLYITYNGLWRFRLSDENGISFNIRQLKAA